MNSNTIKTCALVGTALASVTILYGNLFLAGLIVGLLKTPKEAVNTDNPQGDPKTILDLMN